MFLQRVCIYSIRPSTLHLLQLAGSHIMCLQTLSDGKVTLLILVCALNPMPGKMVLTSLVKKCFMPANENIRYFSC